MLENVILMPGVDDLISKCSSQNIKMGIATSSNKKSALEKIGKHAILLNHISVVVCGDDNEVNAGKPEPDIYLVAGTTLKLKNSLF